MLCCRTCMITGIFITLPIGIRRSGYYIYVLHPFIYINANHNTHQVHEPTMSYEHIAILPFLLDSSHLTPEEVTERDANPTLWAARRYGQPEHIFRAAGRYAFSGHVFWTETSAAERHGNGSSETRHSRFLAAQTQASLASSSRTTSQSSPATFATSDSRSHAAQSFNRQDANSSPPTRSSLPASPSLPSGPSSPYASSPSESYFSTVLSPEPSQEDPDNDLYEDSGNGPRHDGESATATSQRSVKEQKAPTSSKKKGKMRA